MSPKNQIFWSVEEVEIFWTSEETENSPEDDENPYFLNEYEMFSTYNEAGRFWETWRDENFSDYLKNQIFWSSERNKRFWVP